MVMRRRCAGVEWSWAGSWGTREVGADAETEMHLLKADDVMLKNVVGRGKTTKSKGNATVTVTEMSLHLLQRPKGKQVK